MTTTIMHDYDLTIQECHQRLTQTWSKVEVDPETGERVTGDVPALLLELREALFGGMESTGGVAGFRPRMPISDGSLDLYETIDQEIAAAWAHSFPGQIPTADTPEKLLSQVVAVNRPHERVEILVSSQRVDHRGTRDEHWWVERSTQTFTVEAIVRRWVNQITDFFDPPRTREIQAPCIQCGEEWAWRQVSGESTPYRVFVFVQDSHGNTLEARCQLCGTSWGPHTFRWLAEAMAGHMQE